MAPFRGDGRGRDGLRVVRSAAAPNGTSARSVEVDVALVCVAVQALEEVSGWRFVAA